MRSLSRNPAGLTAIALGIVASLAVAKAENLEGRWAATMVQGSVTISFRLDISGDGSNVTGTLYNGEDKEFTTSASIRKAVRKHFVGISYGGVGPIVGRLRQALRPGRFRPVRGQHRRALAGIQVDRKGSVRLRGERDQPRTRAVKMAGHKLTILPAAGERPRVAIHAQDRGGDLAALLLDD